MTDIPPLIMKVIKLALLVVAFISQVTVYASYAPFVEQEKQPCDISIEKCVEWYAKENNIPIERLRYIITNESQWNQKAVGDMNIICKRTGNPVRARGLLQITECFYPEIDDKCAFNAECSLNKMIKLIKDTDTCKSQWTTCRNYFYLYEGNRGITSL